jgi:hypothetical protein
MSTTTKDQLQPTIENPAESILKSESVESGANELDLLLLISRCEGTTRRMGGFARDLSPMGGGYR